MATKTRWNCTADKSACICFHQTNGWFSRTGRFKRCQGLLLLWNSHCQLLTLGFILELMKRWGLLLPAGIGSNLSDQGRKKRCWQNEWHFYPVQMDQQKVGIKFFFPCLVPYSCWWELCVGRQGSSLRGWECSAQGEFPEHRMHRSWAGAVTCRRISRVSDHIPALCGLRNPMNSCWSNKVEKLMLIKLCNPKCCNFQAHSCSFFHTYDPRILQ